jgi:hypothetical protein
MEEIVKNIEKLVINTRWKNTKKIWIQFWIRQTNNQADSIWFKFLFIIWRIIMTNVKKLWVEN